MNSEDEDYESYDYAPDSKTANERAERFRYFDPFAGKIPPALLSSQDFIKYVKVTSLIYPFFEDKQRIKAASYEARVGGKSIRWDEDGKRIVTVFNEHTPLHLPKNTITFVQIESTIRLPQYIALRFNLRSANVHRGLLLGTGPLIDPEFEGDILIPIHNLTDEDYTIPREEGLIWIEFTKTSSAPDPAWKYRIEARKTLVTAESYLEKANKNNPIRSSIKGAIRDVRQDVAAVQSAASAASDSAAAAERSSRYFAAIGVVGIVGVGLSSIIGLHSYFGTMAQLADGVQEKAVSALAKVESTTSTAEETKKGLEEAKREIERLRSELEALKERLRAPDEKRIERGKTK
jgi:deoxycytidine triphosphate deaminase